MVNGVNNTSTGQTTTAADQAKGKATLAKDDFLKLMMSQIKYQDPLNPMDGTQFSAQLAQFSSLEQLTNMNESLNKSLDANYILAQSVNNTMSVSLIGKEIKLSGGAINFNGEKNIDLGYNLPADTKSVTVNIYNSEGKIVKTFEDKNILKGEHKLSWDFTDNDGSKLPEGNYKFEVKAKDYSDKDIVAEIYKLGLITSVRYGEQGTKIVVGNSEYSLSDVAEIFGTDSNGGS
ncbi:MAG: flagellar hook assembly protein FlgD [Bacillota bacterium]